MDMDTELEKDKQSVIPVTEIIRLKSLVPGYIRQLNELKDIIINEDSKHIEHAVEERQSEYLGQELELQTMETESKQSQLYGVNSDANYFPIGCYPKPAELQSNYQKICQLQSDSNQLGIQNESIPWVLVEEKYKWNNEPEILDTVTVEPEPVKINKPAIVTLPRTSPLVVKVEAYEHHDGFQRMPDQIAKKLFNYFDYRLLQICRLVCTSWNKQISTSRVFLESSIFHMSTNIEVIKIFENSAVEWMYIQFHGITSENKTRSNYQQKFLHSKFQPYTITTNSLISLHLYKSEMGKDSLLRWLTVCKWLRYVEITDCGFVSTIGRTGWKQDPSVLALEHLRTLSVQDMILSRLVDTLKLLYPQIKCLEQLKISEKKRQPSQTKNIVATMEGELINLLKRYLHKSRPKMQSLHLSLQKFENESMVHDFFKKIPCFQIPLLEFGFEYLTHKGGPCSNLSLGSDFHPWITLKGIFKKSDSLKQLYIPGLVVNIGIGGDISSFFPASLEDLSAQITLPDSNPESHLLIGLQKPECSLKKIAIHENSMTDYQWMNLKKCFPFITELTILCPNFGDHNLMTVSSCLVNLQVLKLEKVKQITDFGLTGIDEEYLKSLKESWPRIPNARCEDSVGWTNFPLVGKPISSMEKLREFHCIGLTDITDVGIAHGLFLSNLEAVSIKGGTVKISDTGLDILASNSPFLSSVNFILSPSCATGDGIQQFISKLPQFDKFKSSVELKTPLKNL